jgi:hypothetical protein
VYAVGSLGHRRLLWMVGVRACMRFDRVQARWATCGLLVSMKKIASRKTNAPATAIHLDQHQPLRAATNAPNSPVHIPAHERISGGMCFHTLARGEVVCGVVGVGAMR